MLGSFDLSNILLELMVKAIVLLVAIPFHEFAHAWAADQMGDRTARAMGRLTLNPLAHLDPIGSLMILISGFGWGKPVPVNPRELRGRTLGSMAVTAVAGPLSNLFLAAIFAAPIRLEWITTEMVMSTSWGIWLLQGLWLAVSINVGLALFNMIPLAPLDGFSVLLGVVPERTAMNLAQLQQYGPMLLLVLLSMGWIGSFNVLGAILGPPMEALTGLMLGF
jgi:Zn-dependent protease